jgi:CRISPR-associated endonuclease Csn1
MMERTYRFGFDIGIGSIGWAVISGEKDTARIEDFGVRIFDSGEKSDGKSRKSQERRAFRSVRRLTNRRHFRKIRLKRFLVNIGMLTDDLLINLSKNVDVNTMALKVKALDEKLTKIEIAQCLIHTCNHRGYKPFYMIDDEISDSDAEATDESEKMLQTAYSQMMKNYKRSGLRTISEFICQKLPNNGTDFPNYRNKEGSDNFRLIPRKLLEEEIEKILFAQSSYYPELTASNIQTLKEIIFAQRCFEDGPGDPNNPFRRYTGSLGKIGACPFYKGLERGYRSTLIGDIFAVVNTLSQYRFINQTTGEIALTSDAAKLMLAHVIESGKASIRDLQKLVSPLDILIKMNDNSESKKLSDSIKFINLLKNDVEGSGLSWKDFTSEEQFDCGHPSRIHQIGVVLSKYQTPSKREKALEEIEFLTPELRSRLSNRKTHGAANASDQFMCEAIQAFLKGEIYGNFQYRTTERIASQDMNQSFRKLGAELLKDEEFNDNPVVFRSINETRKIINALVRRYGSPEAVNIEVASDLNRGFLARQEIRKEQAKKEKENELCRMKIAELLKIDCTEVKGSQIDMYKLYNEQNGRSLYSGVNLGGLEAVLRNTHKEYEIDHIIPYSLILDNTLHNKALVFAGENQAKGQRTPLMYLSAEQKEKFLETINQMFSRKENPISAKKYQYCMLKTVYSDESQELLSQWKTRNINDTRYITKYLVGFIKKYLQFSGDAKVYGVKGGYTSQFRKIWLQAIDGEWGSEEKDRTSDLNHALDAVIIANLTPPYLEIASDNNKLQQIFRKNNGAETREYNEYLEDCVRKMKRYYGFQESYTVSLLKNPNRVPAYAPKLDTEVDIRFNITDPAKFNEKVNNFYGDCSDFIVPPHIPLVSYKPERRFQGQIADSNFIKIRKVDGKDRRIVRKSIKEICKKDIADLYTHDQDLLSSLSRILSEREEKYSIEKYMEENSLKEFRTDCGQLVRKVSLLEKNAVSNYRVKQISDTNHSILSSLKYYCVEVYKDAKGKIHCWGIRYVDIVRKGKKLQIKKASIPPDYVSHVHYLMANDYVEITDKNGKVKCAGYYQSVKNINSNLFYFKQMGLSEIIKIGIAQTDEVRKFDMSILGEKGGEIKCSAQSLFLREKESASAIDGLS